MNLEAELKQLAILHNRIQEEIDGTMEILDRTEAVELVGETWTEPEGDTVYEDEIIARNI